MGMVIACTPKRLRCITARALVMGHSENKVRELVAFLTCSKEV